MASKKKPKILIIGTTDKRGGAAGVGWEIGEEMRRRGFWVRYIVGRKYSDSKNVYELRRNKTLKFVTRWLGIDIEVLLKYLRSYLLSNDIDFGAKKEILNHPWFKKSDIVHLHNLHGDYFKLDTLIPLSTNKKTIWTLHDLWAITAHCGFCYDCKSWKGGKHFTSGTNRYKAMLWDNSDYLWNKKRRIYKYSDVFIVTPSRWLKKIVSKSILLNKPIKLIYNGIDTHIFSDLNSRQKTRKKLGVREKDEVILFVAQNGKNDLRKGWSYMEKIIKSYRNNKKTIFVSIGGQKSDYNNLPNNLRVVPFVESRKSLAEYYSAADLFISTSLADNCPLTILEAMATGTPVVAFDSGGVKELVLHKKNGYVAKYKNTTDILAGLKWFFEKTGSERDKIRGACVKRIKDNFSLTKMANSYEELYLNL